MPVVGLERGVRYDAAGLRRAIRKALEPLGGIAAFVREGDRVLVKPNLVAPASPDSGICTHPIFVRAVCDMIAERSPARIHVGDMPGYNFLGEGRRCAEESGLAAALEGGPARIVPFEGTHARTTSGEFRVFPHIDLTREVADADVVISLPTPKTHRLTRYSGAVKNAFGCVAYGTRERLHKLGDYRKFCEGLVDIFGRVRPALTIADMVRVQEGNGPCSGSPLDVGVVLAAADGVALDAVAQYLLGMEPGDVLTTSLAGGRGLGGMRHRQDRGRGSAGLARCEGRGQAAGAVPPVRPVRPARAGTEVLRRLDPDRTRVPARRVRRVRALSGRMPGGGSVPERVKNSARPGGLPALLRLCRGLPARGGLDAARPDLRLEQAPRPEISTLT